MDILDWLRKVHEEHDQHVRQYRIWPSCSSCRESLSESESACLKSFLRRRPFTWVSRELLG